MFVEAIGRDLEALTAELDSRLEETGHFARSSTPLQRGARHELIAPCRC